VRSRRFLTKWIPLCSHSRRDVAIDDDSGSCIDVDQQINLIPSRRSKWSREVDKANCNGGTLFLPSSWRVGSLTEKKRRRLPTLRHHCCYIHVNSWEDHPKLFRGYFRVVSQRPRPAEVASFGAWSRESQTILIWWIRQTLHKPSCIVENWKLMPDRVNPKLDVEILE